MAISLQSNTWHVKDSEGNYLSSAILSTTLPEEAADLLARIQAALVSEEADATNFKNDLSDDLDTLIADTRSILDSMLAEQEQLISDIRSTVQAKTDAQAAAAAAAQSATNIGNSATAAAQSATDAAESASGAATSAVNARLSETNTELLEQSVKNLALSGMTVIEDTTSTEVTLDAEPECRYIYGELVSLEITSFPGDGIVDIIFNSGTTPTILVLPQTAIVPEWFDPTELAANTSYELSIVDNRIITMEWPIVV